MAVNYPYQLHYIRLRIEDKEVRMAYMDVRPARPNGKAVLLMHGKNFNGYYWKDVVAFLSAGGFRVIVPDQVGWGASDKPDIHYSFHLLAANTKVLLDSLGVAKLYVIGHSMGGMLAARFALMYPATVEKLVLEDPIGLEDYKTFVPYRRVETQFADELKADIGSLRKYQQGYYPVWQPEYEQYVVAQYDALQLPDFWDATWASALTYQMIYEQPVVYEFYRIGVRTLLIIGQADRTIVGKNLLPAEIASKHGNYPVLGRWLKEQIRGSELVEMNGVGHIPHIESPLEFKKAVTQFFEK